MPKKRLSGHGSQERGRPSLAKGRKYERSASILYGIPDSEKTEQDREQCLDHLGKMTVETDATKFFGYSLET